MSYVKKAGPTATSSVEQTPPRLMITHIARVVPQDTLVVGISGACFNMVMHESLADQNWQVCHSPMLLSRCTTFEGCITHQQRRSGAYMMESRAHTLCFVFCLCLTPTLNPYSAPSNKFARFQLSPNPT